MGGSDRGGRRAKTMGWPRRRDRRVEAKKVRIVLEGTVE